MRVSWKWFVVFVPAFTMVSVAYAGGDWPLPDGVEAGSVTPALLPEGSAVGPITFAESEFPENTVIDGLMVTTLDGAPLPAPLTFGFTSPDAVINGGPGDITYVQFPNIEGDATGTLTLDFGLDATSVTFGFALSCSLTLAEGATAQALDGNDNPVGAPVSVGSSDLGGGFTENQLTLSPGTAFRSAAITFYPGDECGRFAFDNLAYDGQPVPAVPATAVLLLLTTLALLGVAVLKLRSA